MMATIRRKTGAVAIIARPVAISFSGSLSKTRRDHVRAARLPRGRLGRAPRRATAPFVNTTLTVLPQHG
ncbi:hypothetical protein PQJ75_10875 [Rhodoplanes sp. TEM]|uniref:Uncharacterized protein n=1 Tax=Rhodoplanes tepidamans TaxID=200616 RepID=A0ABT5JB63_RHOTP|nr:MULTISPECIES: hypothetical protein [Rhodoplanes]MDC7786837.1 hypothetical protein [Rhodoplanes tepidamans]MDC7984234.1 hypothetical protein [Rhodoplanes sp. TEM]MDQ0355965.1 hypothetical protein [Rhodoplanes tepidamans]